MQDRIAVGGMAEVFLAKAYGAHGFEKTLAIKRILPELAQNPEFEARFIAEAKVSVRLSHANIVQVLDFGRIGESLFIAMEYVDGLDLAALLRKFKDEGKLIPLPAAFHIAIELVRALDYAHQHNVVHRDVSPSNVLISRAGEVKIADFGIAVASQPHRGATAGPKRVMGKWRYMSPEQTRGDTLDTRSDLFSAAVVMFEIFTGEKLFPGDESEDIIKNIDKMPIPRMQHMRPGIPSRLDEVLAGPLARKPIDRPTRPATVLRSLIELSYESSIMATALDVAEALAVVLPPRKQDGRGALDDVIRRQLGNEEKSVARRTAVTSNKPPGTETMERNDVSTGLFRKLDDDGLARLELDPTAVRHTEPMEKPEITGVQALLGLAKDKDRHTEVGGPPTGQVAKLDPSASVKLPVQGAAKEPTAEVQRRSRVPLVAVVLGVVAVGAVAVWAVTRSPAAEKVAAADAAVAKDAAPEPTTGTFELDSIPAGATITVDGVPQPGVGPLAVSVPAKKKVHVKWELAGYEAREDDYTAEAGKTSIIRPQLVRAPALVFVSTTPPGMEVRLHDQVIIASTPGTSKGLAPEDKAELVIGKAGFDTVKETVKLEAGVTVKVDRAMKESQKFGYVKIALTGTTTWAYVSFNGEPKGKNATMDGITSIRLPAGHQRLFLSNPPAKKSKTVYVDVPADGTAAFSFSLD